MEKVFDFSGEQGSGSQVLLMEIGADHFHYAFLGNDGKISSLKMLQSPALELEPGLDPVLEELASRNISKTIVCSSFPEMVLVPQHKKQGSGIVWKALFDVHGEPHMDDVNEWQVAVVYGIPALLKQQLQSTFSHINFCHYFSCALKTFNGYSDQDQLILHFTHSGFRVIVKKEGKLELAQVYQYQGPLDVVYYLLKIAAETGLDQNKVQVVLSGFIEEDSALYKTLADYFIHLSFAKPANYLQEGHSLPLHYFSSLNNMAACVS